MAIVAGRGRPESAVEAKARIAGGRKAVDSAGSQKTTDFGSAGAVAENSSRG